MNRHGFIAPVADLDLSLLVSWGYPARRGHDPDLQEMYGLRLRMVELAVRDSRARTHPLHFADSDDRAGPETILMLERAFENVGDDLHVAMPMSRKSRTCANPILVDYPQRAKPALRLIVVFAK